MTLVTPGYFFTILTHTRATRVTYGRLAHTREHRNYTGLGKDATLLLYLTSLIIILGIIHIKKKLDWIGREWIRKGRNVFVRVQNVFVGSKWVGIGLE